MKFYSQEKISLMGDQRVNDLKVSYELDYEAGNRVYMGFLLFFILLFILAVAI